MFVISNIEHINWVYFRIQNNKTVGIFGVTNLPNNEPCSLLAITNLIVFSEYNKPWEKITIIGKWNVEKWYESGGNTSLETETPIL